MSTLRVRRKEPVIPNNNMSENEAAAAIQAWFQGNQSRVEEDSKNMLTELQSGASGASGYEAGSQLTRRKTVRMSKVVPNTKELQKPSKGQIFFAEDKFKAYLKGLIDIQGRMTGPFTVLINFGPRIPANDKDFKKYESYFALHVDKNRAWFSVKINGKETDLTDQTDVVVSNIDMGLDDDTIQTYWLSYDRDNMMIKYGKGYAMTETTLIMCDFAEGVNTAEKMAKKKKTVEHPVCNLRREATQRHQHPPLQVGVRRQGEQDKTSSQRGGGRVHQHGERH